MIVALRQLPSGEGTRNKHYCYSEGTFKKTLFLVCSLYKIQLNLNSLVNALLFSRVVEVIKFGNLHRVRNEFIKKTF